MSEFKYTYTIDDSSPMPTDESTMLIASFGEGNCVDEFVGEDKLLIKFRYRKDYNAFVKHIEELKKQERRKLN